MYHSGGEAGNGETGGEGVGVYGKSLSPLQFCCEPKTSLKIEVLIS